MIDIQNLSIRSKFLISILATVLLSLIVSLILIAAISHSLAKQDFNRQLEVLVDITSERTQAALAFRDKRVVNQNLESLSKLPSIDLACIYREDGALFGKYERYAEKNCPETVEWETQSHDFDAYIFEKTLSVNGIDYGVFKVQANDAALKARLHDFLRYASIIILISVLVGYLIAFHLQKVLTKPIINLSKLSRYIAETRDFSVRADSVSEDETGTLAKSFNRLISTIQNNQIQMEEMVIELKEKTTELESQNEIVEERNKQIKSMFTGASHDLKQPLQAMVLFVNALKDISNIQQIGLLNKLDLAIQNMRSLFEDLLDVSKLENRLDTIHIGVVEIKSLLDSVFHEFDALAADKNLKLKFYAKDCEVYSNSKMLERIVRNLLSNAIRYTSNGGILLACRQRENSVWIEVWDTGRGIPEESMQLIFNSFYQVERQTEEGQQGYGLGLSIVKRLSELLGHRIEIKSKSGRGTMFRIILQKVDVDQTQIAQNEIKQDVFHCATKQELSLFPNKKINVLLVDDDEFIREGVTSLLESWTMQVVSFSSISDLKRFFFSNREACFDVMVSDFQLSDRENGLDAIRLVRENLGKDIPALIITGTKDEKQLELIKQSGIRKLSKPVKPAKLRALINHLLGQSKS